MTEITIIFKGKDYSQVFFNERSEGTRFFLKGVTSGSREALQEDTDYGFVREGTPLAVIFGAATDKICKQMAYDERINNNSETEEDTDEKESLTRKLGNNLFYQGYIGVAQTFIYGEEIFEKSDGGMSNLRGCKFKVRLQIQSRFDDDRPYFLSTMLLRRTVGNDRFIGSAPSSMDDLFDYLLVYMFFKKLRELASIGYYKTYRRFEGNDDRLRGAIDFARHIRLNIGQNNGKIAYSYRENTIDNPFNYLLLEAYRFIKKQFGDYCDRLLEAEENKICKRYLDGLSNMLSFSQYSVKALLSQNKSPISHPFYVEYEALRKICMKILQLEGVSIFDGEYEDTQTFFYYIPELWEKYLESYLNRAKTSYTVRAQYRKNIICNERRGFSISKPDFVFLNDDVPFMMLDAKFKKRWDSVLGDYKGGKNPWHDNTIKEDYNKCIRDMNALSAHAAGVIFPVNDALADTAACREYFVSEINKSDVFYVFPICVPDTDEKSYSQWSDDFDKSLEMRFEEISGHIEKQRQRHINLYIKLKRLEQELLEE